jgi:hypothetical protein
MEKHIFVIMGGALCGLFGVCVAMWPFLCLNAIARRILKGRPSIVCSQIERKKIDIGLGLGMGVCFGFVAIWISYYIAVDQRMAFTVEYVPLIAGFLALMTVVGGFWADESPSREGEPNPGDELSREGFVGMLILGDLLGVALGGLYFLSGADFIPLLDKVGKAVVERLKS